MLKGQGKDVVNLVKSLMGHGQCNPNASVKCL